MRTKPIRILFVAFSVWTICCVWGNLCCAQDTGETRARDAFEKGSYPWYDSDTDSINYSPEINAGDSAGTAGRTGIKKRATVTRSTRTTSQGMSWQWITFWLVLLGVLLAALVGVAIWLLLKVDPPGGFSQYENDWERGGAFGSDRVERLPFDVQNQTGDFRAAAEQAYNSGDYRAAVIYLFSHVLLTLDRHKRVRLRKGKTNRQYLTEMKNSGAISLTTYYERLMVSFESAFFGDYEVRSSQFEESWNALPEFQNRLSQLGEVARD